MSIFFFKRSPDAERFDLEEVRRQRVLNGQNLDVDHPWGLLRREDGLVTRRNNKLKQRMTEIDFSFFIMFCKSHPENWILTDSQYLLSICAKPDTVLSLCYDPGCPTCQADRTMDGELH